jgi:hypothetical protein
MSNVPINQSFLETSFYSLDVLHLLPVGFSSQNPARYSSHTFLIAGTTNFSTKIYSGDEWIWCLTDFPD